MWETLCGRRLLYGTLPELCDTLRVCVTKFFDYNLLVLCEVMATGGDHKRLRVTVLTGEANWASWKVQMRHQLRSRKLWDIVRGEERIATGAEQGEKIAFEERCIEATMRLTFVSTES